MKYETENPFNNIIVDPLRRVDNDWSDERCIDKMHRCLQNTIDALDKSKYFDKNRVMQYQYEVIVTIINSYLSGKKSFVLEAPTGVGKSIIAMIVVETIKKYRDYSLNNPVGYILTSSKMLQDQLNTDAEHYSLMWAVLKGQGNYICNQNQKSFLDRECKDTSIKKAMETEPCAAGCKYMIDRNKAMVYDNAVFSYAYWLTTMNYVYEFIGEYAPFSPRHITVFDECHMLSDSVQSLFQSQISTNDIKKFNILHDLLLECNINSQIINKSIELIEIIKSDLYALINKSISISEMFDRLIKYQQNVNTYSKIVTQVVNRYLPKDPKLWLLPHRRMDKYADLIFNYDANLAFFINENVESIEYIVKTFVENDDSTVMVLRTLNEHELMKRHVHKYCDFQLFMSATLGDIDIYAKNIGLEDYESLYIDSKFDYDKSPIYTLTPPISMAAKHKLSNMSELMHRILKVCDMHPNERGLIHTGNFEISRNFREFIWEWSNTPARFIFYQDSKQKQEAIKKLEKQKNAVLIGPSLTEGLDLKNDLCRFMILAKVPYPLLDEFNQMKIKLFPEWYGWKTLTTVIQSLGRGIRHKSDWCVTYLIDSCFTSLFDRNRVPRYISKRFDKYNIGNIEQEILKKQYSDSGLFDLDCVTTNTNDTKNVISNPFNEGDDIDELPF